MADEWNPRDGRDDLAGLDDPAPEQRAEADALDVRIGRALAGQAAATEDPVVSWLALAMRTDPPPAIAQRVAAARAGADRRRLRPLRIALGALAYLFLSHGVGNIVGGDWIARNVGDASAPHGYLEGGLALLAVGALVVGALVRRSWMPAAVTAGVPLGLAFGVLGIAEAGTFGFGAVMHLTQAGVAAFVGYSWWRLGRYRRMVGGEDRA